MGAGFSGSSLEKLGLDEPRHRRHRTWPRTRLGFAALARGSAEISSGTDRLRFVPLEIELARVDFEIVVVTRNSLERLRRNF